MSYPILGLKLRTVGIKLRGPRRRCADPLDHRRGRPGHVRLAAVPRPHPAQAGSRRRSTRSTARPENFLSLPSTQRWAVLALVVVAFVWPFFASRGAVDIATLILIYVMLGIGLNIVSAWPACSTSATSASTR
ncbi:hypothetical protein ACPA9J_12385 [Pseudomonas aeruginosa]